MTQVPQLRITLLRPQTPLAPSSFAIDDLCVVPGCFDDDAALAAKPSWSGYTCSKGKKYCTDSVYGKDMVVCPVTCGKCTAVPTFAPLVPTIAPTNESEFNSLFPTLSPTTAMMTASPTAPLRFELRKHLKCAQYITSIDECNEAAKQLGLADTTAEDDEQSKKLWDPPGCYLEGGDLKMNLDGSNTGTCSCQLQRRQPSPHSRRPIRQDSTR